MRNLIKNKLLEVQTDGQVFYGLAPNDDKLKDYNLIIFSQDKLAKSGSSRIDLKGYWRISICRENFISDDLVVEIIKKLSEINGLKLSDETFNYVYARKGGTNEVVEILELTFTKSIKGIEL